jgi:hypothetical protein
MNTKTKNKLNEASKPPNATSHKSAKASLNRHKRACAICRHPHREAIEDDFLRWRSPDDIAEEHKLYNRRTIYRHAHATGLWQRRRSNLRFVLEHVIERAEGVPVTANAVIKAVIAHARINDDGVWIDPPPRIVIIRKKEPSPDSTSHTELLENAPTP